MYKVTLFFIDEFVGQYKVVMELETEKEVIAVLSSNNDNVGITIEEKRRIK